MQTTPKRKINKNAWGWIGLIGFFLLTKIKWVFALLKIGKFTTLASMFVSLGAYALFYGWKFAIAIIYLIFVHEMGHLVAAKIKKIPTSPAVFIPFLGAAIGINPKNIKNAQTEFFVAYGGPLAGLLSILPAIALYLATSDPYWALVTQLGALINLFNLFPVSPLDGGRIVSVLSTKIWFIGLVVLAVMLFISPDPILILILIFGLITWWDRLKEHTKVEILKHEEQILVEINEDIQAAQNQANEVINGNYEKNENGHIYAFHLLANQLHKRKVRMDYLLANETDSSQLIMPKKKRLQIKKWKAEKEQLNRVLNKMQMMRANAEEQLNINMEDLRDYNEKKLQEVRKEINRLKTYYDSSLPTKARALILYLALAIVLALLLVYAMNILDSNQLTNF
ncbi:site-2 protease family protein [Aquibacillus albus]|uniref:Zn-dependent protease n=1 Tax=Aquibacillus albus TaxID=1168171 RepID=A0ABS2MYF7_9BACI|nr:site-2 protease family protein [Aquibacillus albus]MBM7570871.1 Zn-dependent protease [Aquibacillus albus]